MNQCNSQNSNRQDMQYYIEVSNLYFGRPQCITILTNDSIKSEINKTHGKEKQSERNLTIKEIEKIQAFIKQFPLSELNTQYIDERTEDGTQLRFKIRIEKQEKQIFVANMYQDDLAKLVKLIVSLLPEDYIGYNKEALSR